MNGAAVYKHRTRGNIVQKSISYIIAPVTDYCNAARCDAGVRLRIVD